MLPDCQSFSASTASSSSTKIFFLKRPRGSKAKRPIQLDMEVILQKIARKFTARDVVLFPYTMITKKQPWQIGRRGIVEAWKKG